MRTFCAGDSYAVPGKVCVVKNKWTKGGFSTGKKENRSCSVRRLSIVVLMFFSSFHMGISNFRIGILLVLSRQILNFTTSDPRQDGQSSPFTTSSSEKVNRMSNCRASIATETEKPSLMEHQRLHPLLFAFQSQDKSRWIVLIVVRFKIVPSSRRISEFTLPSEVRVRTKPSVCCCAYTAVLLNVAHTHSSSTPYMGVPHAHDDDVACCCLWCWARL